jgi:hypothetical protein
VNRVSDSRRSGKVKGLPKEDCEYQIFLAINHKSLLPPQRETADKQQVKKLAAAVCSQLDCDIDPYGDMAETTGGTLVTVQVLAPTEQSVEHPGNHSGLQTGRDNRKGHKNVSQKDRGKDELRLAFKKLQIRNRRPYAIDHGVLEDGDRQAFCAAGS